MFADVFSTGEFGVFRFNRPSVRKSVSHSDVLHMLTTKSTGFTRLYYATLYSVKGLHAAFLSEPAIRQELAAIALLLPLACYLEVTLSEKLLMIMSLFIVLIAELLNSSIEALADRVSDEVHVLIGKAKDIGSAAVFISLLLVAVVWGAVLLKM